ncbi:type I-E CRISPR-associated protein Cse1/CasA [Desulforhopalus singaporensis]|uniref:CRISPR system Cascade subunit CasA n=1 Tax=Desulforhopalus singaporensis TaxID=91360 RepID=A0A1H0TW13_9BACT|nr:type I-E CRISPR-associated protein Cse1/CasA [Desulforhopalus singaporensis]SDP57736.1 CRISPR system Cascade subunit CasA [Desulforhopalus singaporensis]
MNIAFDPWIPTVNATGDRELASLHDMLTEGSRFSDLAVQPHERISLMRLFLCVAHAALDGPKTYDDWCDVPSDLPEAAGIYLKKWQDSFELFHPEKPWLQVAKLVPLTKDSAAKTDPQKDWISLSRLKFTKASGNNSTLFDSAARGSLETEYTPEEIALNLLVFQNFFVAGGKASSRCWGKQKIENPPNPKGGPCSGKSILYTFLRGQNLAETIFLNLNSFEDLAYHYEDASDWLGKPLWEQPITSPDDQAAIDNATRTHLGRLVPQTRQLCIHQNRQSILLGAGFTYPKYQDTGNTFHPDTFATMVRNQKEERILLSAKPDIAIWRELHSLVVKRKNNTDSGCGALCLLNSPDAESCDIVVCAMITNPTKAAEIVDLVESVFHIPAQLRVPEGTVAYEAEVKHAATWQGRLAWAVESYRAEIDGGWEGRLKSAGPKKHLLRQKLHAQATGFFWTSVEKQLPLLMAYIKAIDTDDAQPRRELWRATLGTIARDAYRTACGQETPRKMRAFANGWRKLFIKSEATNEV